MNKKQFSIQSIWTILIVYFGLLIHPLESTECPEGMVQFGDTCYKQINGCLRYKSGTECLQCSQNFNLKQGLCLISNQAVNIIFLQNSYKQKPSNIKGQANPFQLTESDSIKFDKIKNYLTKKYSNISFSLTTSIRNILYTPYQTYYQFVWTNDKNITFLFEISIDIQQKIQQFLIQKLDSSLYPSLFSNINQNLISKYEKKLVESTLLRIVTISKNLYKLHYFSDFGSHYICFIQKTPFLEIKGLETIQWQYNQSQIFDYVVSQHPLFAREKGYSIVKKQNTSNPQYQFTFPSQSKVVVEQIPTQKYRIIFLYRQKNKTLNQSSSTKLVGGYQIFKNNEDQIIRKVVNHLYKQFAFLVQAQISKIEYQIVAGTNFLIHLQDEKNNNQYTCKIFYSLSGEINILQIYLNAVLIHTQPLSPIQLNPTYDYKKDLYFSKVLQYIKQIKKLPLPDTILYVNREQKSNQQDNFFQYDIVYQQNTFVIANYFYEGPKMNTTQIVDLIINGDNQYEDNNINRASTMIESYLQKSKKWIDPLIIEYIKQTKPNEYFCKIITQFGSYFYKIIQKHPNQFQITYLQLVDEQQNCMKYSFEQIIIFEQSQKQFLSDLFKNQNIPSVFQLVSFTKGITDNKILYRLLYRNPQTNRKIQIILRQQTDYLVVQSRLDRINGLEMFTDQNLYKKIVQNNIKTYYNTLQNARTIVGVKNTQKSLTYFAVKSNKQVIYEVQLDSKLQKSSIKTFFQKQISKVCQKFDDKGNCKQCKQGEISLFTNCYQKMKNCMYQLGQICIMCDGQYSLINNQCTNDCKKLI